MGKINVLGFDVANLIAAGEVVDKPASIVKELVENAVDSGADSITVEIKNGGISHIRVSDNGCGMDHDDLPLAVLRHATSKIKNAHDLDSISTLGFRGEALAAIASVTKLKIYTRPENEHDGSFMLCEGGEITDLCEAGCSKGTTVIADELFYNVPARRKFLKRDATECAKITEIMEKVALSVPDISIKYITDSQVRFITPGDGKLSNVIYSIFGKQTASRLIPVDRSENGVRVSGYVSEPDLTFSRRTQEIFFVNGRSIRSPLLMSALERAYVSRIPQDKFPMCVLNISISPGAVDVNVHPTKLEVKFSNEKTVSEALHYAVLTALNTTDTRPSIKIGNVYGSESYSYKANEAKNAKAPLVSRSKTEEQLSIAVTDVRTPAELSENSASKTVREPEKEQSDSSPRGISSMLAGYDIPDFLSKKKAHPATSQEEPVNTADEKNSAELTPASVQTSRDEAKSLEPQPKSSPSNEEKTEKAPAYAMTLTSETVKEDDEIPFYKIIGEAYDCYVMIELQDRILMIDKHAAHERIIFDELCRRRKEKDKEAQLLLAPIEVYLNDEEIVSLLEYADDIKSIGFEFMHSHNEKRITITAIPTEISTESAPDTFCAMIARLTQGHGGVESAEADFFEKALYQASCKAAIKGGRHYGIEHIDWICKRILKKPGDDGKIIKTCPHGRPVAFEIKKSSIERQFSRID